VVRTVLTVVVSLALFLVSLCPFIKSVEARRIDAKSVQSNSTVILTHGGQLGGMDGTVADHQSHWSHSSHESHHSHYSSRY